jgi:alkylmercury lyase
MIEPTTSLHMIAHDLAGTFPAVECAPLAPDEPADVRSACRLTGMPVRLRVDRGGISDAEPADPWVSFPPMESTSTADIVESFCCHVHFLAGRDAAQRWLGEHPGGRVLDLRDAYEVGQMAIAPLRAGTAAAR